MEGKAGKIWIFCDVIIDEYGFLGKINTDITHLRPSGLPPVGEALSEHCLMMLWQR